MAEDDQAVHARGFEPTDRKVSGIEAATLTSLLTRSGTVLRSWRDCRVEVLGEGLFSKMRSCRGSSIPSGTGAVDV